MVGRRFKPARQKVPERSLLLVVLTGPLLRKIQALIQHGRVPGDELDLEFPRDRNQRGFELVVLHVVGVGRVVFAGHDLIGR